jgi:hypothetical protein
MATFASARVARTRQDPDVRSRRRNVYVTVTTVDTAREPIENAPIVAEEMERWLRETDGFEGFLLLAGEGKAVGLSFWASREVAEHHTFARTQFRERILSIAGVRIEEIVDYEVVFARLGSGWASALGR